MKNRKKWVSVLAGVMAGMMLLTILMGLLPTRASAASSSEIKEDIRDLENQQAQIQSQLDDLEDQLEENWESLTEAVEQKNNIDQQIALLYAEIDMINEQIRNYTLLIAENQARLDEAETKLAELNAAHKERIRAMEEEGKLSYWSVLFKANSFTDLIDRLAMIQEIHEADQRRLAELDAAAKEVSDARNDLDAEKTALEASRADMLAAQTVLDEKRAEADAILAQLNADQRAMEELEAQYEDEEAVLAQQIAAAEKEYTKALKREEEEKKKQEAESGVGMAPDANQSGWGQPCAYRRLTSPYGYRTHPTTGEWKFHHGVDLANSQGTPIYATRSGTVTVATYGGTYGNYVTINHYDGYSSLYAHMTRYVVSKGDYVEKGQLIGYMGSTGRSTGPHLHFSIYYNGESVNPMNYIK